MVVLKLLFCFVAGIVVTSALDVTLTDFSCDTTLPIYATAIGMYCGASKSCTFGSEATLYGTFVYNGTANAGLQNDVVYATADLNFMTLKYHLFDNFPLDICSKNYIEANASNTNACPGDGIYYFKLPYTLPSTDNTKSWFASGWKGNGDVVFYPQQGTSSTKVAYCQLHMGTSVTAGQGAKGFTTPSAALTTILLLLLAVFIALLACYVACRRRKNRDKRLEKEDLVSFHRMNDDLSSNKPNSLA